MSQQVPPTGYPVATIRIIRPEGPEGLERVVEFAIKDNSDEPERLPAPLDPQGD